MIGTEQELKLPSTANSVIFSPTNRQKQETEDETKAVITCHIVDQEST